jgi:hypothetical protein
MGAEVCKECGLESIYHCYVHSTRPQGSEVNCLLEHHRYRPAPASCEKETVDISGYNC